MHQLLENKAFIEMFLRKRERARADFCAAIFNAYLLKLRKLNRLPMMVLSLDDLFLLENETHFREYIENVPD